MDEDPSTMMPEPSGFVAFSGEGNRLDGKKKKLISESESEPQSSQARQVCKLMHIIISNSILSILYVRLKRLFILTNLWNFSVQIENNLYSI